MKCNLISVTEVTFKGNCGSKREVFLVTKNSPENSFPPNLYHIFSKTKNNSVKNPGFAMGKNKFSENLAELHGPARW